MTDREHISQEDLAFYAMGSFSTEESEAIRAHLMSCVSCRTGLAEFSGDLALVGLAVEQHAMPEGARQRFIDRISADAQEAEQAATVSIATAERHRVPAAVWIPWAMAAGLAIAVISLGVKIKSLEETLRNETSLLAGMTTRTSHAQRVLEVLTAPSAQRATLTASKALTVPTGRTIYLADNGGLIFQANNLAHLPSDKAYELWLIPANGKSPIPAGVFRPDATGSASVVLPPLPKGVPAKAFAVTVEKLEGSETPTLPLVLSGAASSIGE
jgi:anti-sigma-K factor RskA